MSKELRLGMDPLTEDDVRGLARAAGVDLAPDDALEVRLRLSAWLEAMARVPDAGLDDLDPDPMRP